MSFMKKQGGVEVNDNDPLHTYKSRASFIQTLEQNILIHAVAETNFTT